MVRDNVDVVQWGTDRFRIGPWRGDARIAFITPMGGHPVAGAAIERCLGLLGTKGYRSALTAALTAAEQDAFLASGFTVHERLHLLRRDLAGPFPPARPHHLRRALPFDLAAVLDLDARAFDAFWRLDRDGLRDARRATPVNRYRVAVTGSDRVGGYAVTGRAGTTAYLQRLAVHPDQQHQGFGTALVVDAFAWARRRGATTMLVNTQLSNTGALALYEHLGFVLEPPGLAVLERTLDPEPTP